MTRLTAPWLTAPGTVAVMTALGDAYFVGGCVRDALIGRPVSDIDICTPLLPEVVIDRATGAGLRTIPTGIDHGTVTVMAGGAPFEVTTFRRDVETDGRHAVVAFTNALEEDAARRDLTINALYATQDGKVIDPFGGLEDLTARRVRFVGEPAQRITEDYLRILRFFRFSAWYGMALDDAGLSACAGHRDGLQRIARERIGAEMRKLLSAPDPVPAMAAMAETGVLAQVLPGAAVASLPRVVAAEKAAGMKPDWRTRLFAMGAADPGEALRLSRAEAAFLKQLGEAMTLPPEPAAYRHGVEVAERATLLRAAEGAGPLPDAAMRKALTRAATRELPVTAQDLMVHGMTPGPAIGEALRRAEALWFASGMTVEKPALLDAITEDAARINAADRKVHGS